MASAAHHFRIRSPQLPSHLPIRPGMDLLIYWPRDLAALWNRGQVGASEFATWR
jgi:hypothetical protein